jgi:hypothetical protein
MSRSDALAWLTTLIDAAADLPRERAVAPYWSQRGSGQPRPDSSLPTIVLRVRTLVAQFEKDGYFAGTVGYDCVDGNGDAESSPPQELARRVGKPHLWNAAPDEWEDADLFDFIEVMHDLAARPTLGYYHSYSNCGWHPLRFSRRSGQRLYRWKMNGLLDTTTLDLRLAESGEDTGRLVRVTFGNLAQLVDEVIEDADTESANAVAHAVALFRARTATRQSRRSAVIELAGILERRRSLLKQHLLTGDESALFEIANKFDIRHRSEAQRTNYDDDFLDWIFYWYLATVHLMNRILARRQS